jgi:hypothetical protein
VPTLTLREGDKRSRQSQGAPKYSPDLNPIEQVFAKLKHSCEKPTFEQPTASVAQSATSSGIHARRMRQLIPELRLSLALIVLVDAISFYLPRHEPGALRNPVLLRFFALSYLNAAIGAPSLEPK